MHEIHAEWCIDAVRWMEPTWKSLVVGRINIYIFGEDSEAIDLYEISIQISGLLADVTIKHIGELHYQRCRCQLFNKEPSLTHSEVINKDWFMTLLDLEDYIVTRTYVIYSTGRVAWLDQVIVNIAKAGFFSSDVRSLSTMKISGT